VSEAVSVKVWNLLCWQQYERGVHTVANRILKFVEFFQIEFSACNGR